MNFKKMFFAALFFVQAAIISGRPLTIINSTVYPAAIDVDLSGGQVQVFLAPGTKETIQLDNDTFEGISWNGYVKNYTVNIRQDAPAMLNGGAFVIAKNGWCMYDNKKGKGVDFIQGQ